jgi:DNA topoisomerase 2-associated protein PAT1
MSFFGFEEKDVDAAHEKEEVPIFTWGEDSYDGLGDVLHERGDELNDETFGTVGIVGKDFDFSNATLPSLNDRQKEQVQSLQNPTDQAPSDTPFLLHEYHDPAILNDNQLCTVFDL